MDSIIKTTIIDKIDSNQEDSVSKTKKIIEKYKDADADAVKFQMWRAKDGIDRGMNKNQKIFSNNLQHFVIVYLIIR